MKIIKLDKNLKNDKKETLETLENNDNNDKKEILENNEIIDISNNNIKKSMLILMNDISNQSSQEIIKNIDNHNYHINLINKLYMNNDFIEKKILIREIKIKIASYKQQDIRKNIYEKENMISLEDIIEKLVLSKLKCYYCKQKLYIFSNISRNKYQWTLDRINNFQEHSNTNTIISCLKCNLQRRKKNSEKFLFSKQLETKQIVINKLN
jgi:hypothetical protein